jgi:hypothetical protein
MGLEEGFGVEEVSEDSDELVETTERTLHLPWDLAGAIAVNAEANSNIDKSRINADGILIVNYYFSW